MTMSDGLTGKLAWTEADPEEPLLVAATAELGGGRRPRGRPARSGPSRSGRLLERIAAPRWTLPERIRRDGLPAPALVQRYARLAGGSLTAVFILSQHDAAVRRLLAAPENRDGRALADASRPGTMPSRRWGSRT